MFPQMISMLWEGSRDCSAAPLTCRIMVEDHIPFPQLFNPWEESQPGFPIQFYCALCCQQRVFSMWSHGNNPVYISDDSQSENCECRWWKCQRCAGLLGHVLAGTETVDEELFSERLLDHQASPFSCSTWQIGTVSCFLHARDMMKSQTILWHSHYTKHYFHILFIF